MEFKPRDKVKVISKLAYFSNVQNEIGVILHFCTNDEYYTYHKASCIVAFGDMEKFVYIKELSSGVKPGEQLEFKFMEEER